MERQPNQTNIDRMKISDPLLHPDSTNENHYVMGTKLQKSSHNKLTTCKYHHLELAQDSHDIPTMQQESMNQVRKHRTIQGDKLRSFESCFIANYIVDFKHNQSKTRAQLKRLIQRFNVVGRDPDTWRGCGIQSIKTVLK